MLNQRKDEKKCSKWVIWSIVGAFVVSGLLLICYLIYRTQCKPPPSSSSNEICEDVGVKAVSDAANGQDPNQLVKASDAHKKIKDKAAIPKSPHRPLLMPSKPSNPSKSEIAATEKGDSQNQMDFLEETSPRQSPIELCENVTVIKPGCHVGDGNETYKLVQKIESLIDARADIWSATKNHDENGVVQFVEIDGVRGVTIIYKVDPDEYKEHSCSIIGNERGCYVYKEDGKSFELVDQHPIHRNIWSATHQSAQNYVIEFTESREIVYNVKAKVTFCLNSVIDEPKERCVVWNDDMQNHGPYYLVERLRDNIWEATNENKAEFCIYFAPKQKGCIFEFGQLLDETKPNIWSVKIGGTQHVLKKEKHRAYLYNVDPQEYKKRSCSIIGNKPGCYVYEEDGKSFELVDQHPMYPKIWSATHQSARNYVVEFPESREIVYNVKSEVSFCLGVHEQRDGCVVWNEKRHNHMHGPYKLVEKLRDNAWSAKNEGAKGTSQIVRFERDTAFVYNERPDDYQKHSCLFKTRKRDTECRIYYNGQIFKMLLGDKLSPSSNYWSRSMLIDIMKIKS